jgi:hypothetical protein
VDVPSGSLSRWDAVMTETLSSLLRAWFCDSNCLRERERKRERKRGERSEERSGR